MGRTQSLRSICTIWRIVLLFVLLRSSSSYRLNVPRVLLPYHPTIPVKFLLEVTQPSGGCFNWRSTRPDVVSVTPVGYKLGECSDKAEIRATAKAVSGELSAVVFAEDSASGTMLSCGVTVDQISRIHVDTTTKILFVDAAPARMIVEAFNSEGDKFSTLSEIPIDWELSHSDNGRPLRIVPFEQSTYEAPKEIIALENNKKKGYVILVEGVLTGSATLTARFAESHFASIPPHSLELTVVANLLLLPAHNVYLPLHAVVPFQVQIVRQSSTEIVPMPSSSYFLKVDSERVCSLDKMTSSVRALARGRTDIHLYSQNVDVKAKTGVRPPSTAIFVVDPETIQWAISSGGNWLLQTGTRYKLSVSLLDPHGNTMYISDNLLFQSSVPSEYFDVNYSSKNRTYFEVTPKKIGRAILKSKFVAVVDQSGQRHESTGKVFGEQIVQIVDPVRITPSEVVLPYLPRRRSSFSLKVTGGSGLYDWNVEDYTICTVDMNGVLSSSSPGTTIIVAADKRNPAHKDKAQVSVVDVMSLAFGDTPKEAEVGSDLVLNIQLMGSGPLGAVPFTDCRAADVHVASSNTGVFKPSADATPKLPSEGTGCTTVTVRAVSPGDAKVTVSFDKYEATIDVSAYTPLKVDNNDLALGIDSDAKIRFEGGPRPWILDPSTHYQKVSPDSLVTTKIIDDVLILKCGAKEGVSTVRFQVGNVPSSLLPLPAKSTVEFSVCCARPGRLALSMLNGNQPRCPSNVRIVLSDASMRLALKAHASCGGVDRVLVSTTGLSVRWSTVNKSAVEFEEIRNDHTVNLKAQGIAGTVLISAEISDKAKILHRVSLRAALEIRLVKPVESEPSKLVLWNEAAEIGTVKLVHGSGYFVVDELPGAPFMATVKGSVITVVPRSQGAGTLRILDVCVDNGSHHIPVRITDIHSLVVHGPQFMEVGSEAEITVDAVDEAGVSFSRDHGALSNAIIDSKDANIHISNDYSTPSTDVDVFFGPDAMQVLNIKGIQLNEYEVLSGRIFHLLLTEGIVFKISGGLYRIRALTVGTVSLKASSSSASKHTLTSQPLTIQVFSPLLLLPQEVTLIPDSVFQLEVVGGPQPTPPINFLLNNSKVATIDKNALITSKNLGYASITGTVTIGSGHSSQNTVVLRVVSLAGIRILSSTQNVEKGERLWLTVYGLDESETPFSFGGALYPFKITWMVSHPGVIRTVHPLGASISEVDENRFTMCLEGASAGSAHVKVRVDLSPNAKQHFIGSVNSFETSVTIHVEEPLMMRQPRLMVPSIRLAQNTQLQLETMWPQSVVEYLVPPDFANRLYVSKAGLVRAGSLPGPAVVIIRRTDFANNETSVVPVTISAVNSIDVILLTKIEAISSKPLPYIPVGLKFELQVVFRDSRGRALSASSVAVSYRPHRFDLTEIVPSNANKTLTVTVKSAGETVLKVWNTAMPSQHVFVRLSASEQLYSSNRQPTVSDIACFKSPLAGHTRWSTSDDRLEWLDAVHGVAKFLQPGNAHIAVHVGDQKLTTSLEIRAVQRLQFSEPLPNHVTNIENTSFVFPVIIVSKNTSLPQAIMTDCSEPQLSALSSIRAPFECLASFTNNKIGPAVNILSTRAVFWPHTRSYACIVERQKAGDVHLDVAAAPQMDLEIVARWLGDSQITDAVVSTTFHMAMYVKETEIQLSDVDHKSAVLAVVVPAYQLRHVSASGCAGDIVSVSETRQPSGSSSSANKFFLVKLNIKSAALWSELSEKCSVIIENRITEQTVNVPVRVRIVGHAAKQVYHALDSAGLLDFVLIFLQHYSWIIPSLMWICALGVITIAVYWFIRRRVWEKQGTYVDSSTLRSPSSSLLSQQSISMQSSPSFFRQSPIGKSTPIGESLLSMSGGVKNRPMGAKGEPTLWSTEPIRRN